MRADYKKRGQKVHICDVFSICVEKGTELRAGHPDRKMKGRVCLRGNGVKDEYHQWALFEELGSQPASMSSGKAVDIYGAQADYDTEVADAEMAYTQTPLRGTETHVRLPLDEWPLAWKKAGFIDPVCPLILNLYGHPDAGTFWQEHCDKGLKDSFRFLTGPVVTFMND